MPSPCPEPYVQLAHRLADAAGATLRKYFRRPVELEDKADASLVTVADRDCERAMRALIGEAAPGHGVVGEEYGADRPGAEWVWQLDPIDGTNSFVSGSPLFGVLIALLHRGEAVLGLMEQPILGERWLAHGAAPTTLNGRPCRVRPCAELGRAVHYTSGPGYFKGALRPVLERLTAATRLTRYSADCYAAGLLACGHIDLVVETGLQAHDYAALVPIVENAGGVCTNWLGKRHDMVSDDDLVAAGDAALHARALELLNA
jgi:inositol-phosphate phosphatase/L-galactose 1-phosphate phosphatase/histidinol-phosphatase